MTITAIALPGIDEVQCRNASIAALRPEDRIVAVRAAPYNVEAKVGPGVFESFAPGAFARAVKDPSRVLFLYGHSTTGGTPVGKAVAIEDRNDGLYVEARVSPTPAGDELLTLTADGVLTEASVEFRQIEESRVTTRRGTDYVVRHKRAHLLGVAIVPYGAYGQDAAVLSVRDAATDRAREEHLARLRSFTS